MFHLSKTPTTLRKQHIINITGGATHKHNFSPMTHLLCYIVYDMTQDYGAQCHANILTSYVSTPGPELVQIHFTATSTFHRSRERLHKLLMVWLLTILLPYKLGLLVMTHSPYTWLIGINIIYRVIQMRIMVMTHSPYT